MEKRREIITIVDKGEYQKLMKFINQEDPKALSRFIMYRICGISRRNKNICWNKKLRDKRRNFLPYLQENIFRINSTASNIHQER